MKSVIGDEIHCIIGTFESVMSLSALVPIGCEFGVKYFYVEILLN